MKKICSVIDAIIYVLCFLFLLSSFFKAISYTRIDYYVYNNVCVLILVWLAGIVCASLFTHPLYQWILHFRHL